MSWNWRMVKEKDYISVREVYYSDDGKIESWCDGSNDFVGGETIEELKETYKLMGDALQQPLLEVSGTTIAAIKEI